MTAHIASSPLAVFVHTNIYALLKHKGFWLLDSSFKNFKILLDRPAPADQIHILPPSYCMKCKKVVQHQMCCRQ